MLRTVSFDEILAGKYVGSARLSSIMIKVVRVFVFGDRTCDGVSAVLSFRSSPKYTSGLELIIASVSVKKVWSCNIVRHVFPIAFRRAILLIPTNLS